MHGTLPSAPSMVKHGCWISREHDSWCLVCPAFSVSKSRWASGEVPLCCNCEFVSGLRNAGRYLWQQNDLQSQWQLSQAATLVALPLTVLAGCYAVTGFHIQLPWALSGTVDDIKHCWVQLVQLVYPPWLTRLEAQACKHLALHSLCSSGQTGTAKTVPCAWHRAVGLHGVWAQSLE